MVHAKSCWDPQEKSDGLRILATRYWIRGFKKSACDVWMPNLGPSEKLLESFLGGKVSWADFSRGYRSQMLGKETREPENPRVRNSGQKFTLRLLQRLSKDQTITVLCSCREEHHCHRRLLRQLLQKKL
jgi:uncharacterized protein YeaO (DUF488 family)